MTPGTWSCAGGSKVKAMATDKLLDWMDSIGCAMNDAMRKSGLCARLFP